MSDPACRNFRELLGVYVVGAIEPAERSAVDAHLNQCHHCREELAGLAVLPSLLHRVSLADVEQLTESEQGPYGGDESSADLLPSLLREVRARRRTQRLRTVLAAAAVVLVAAGGGAAVSQALTPTHASHHPSASHGPVIDVTSGRKGDKAATVHYSKSPWGIEMWVRVSGFRQWTACKFWVTTKDGRQVLAGGWIVGPDGDQLWYPVDSGVRKVSVAGFVITSGNRVLLRIPAN